MRYTATVQFTFGGDSNDPLACENGIKQMLDEAALNGILEGAVEVVMDVMARTRWPALADLDIENIEVTKVESYDDE